MKDHIQVVLTLTIPMDALTADERQQWRTQFEELQREIQQTCPKGVNTSLVVSVVKQ